MSDVADRDLKDVAHRTTARIRRSARGVAFPFVVAIVGGALWLLYTVVTLGSTFLCYGGLAESYDAAAVMGIVLGLVVSACAVVCRGAFAWLLTAYGGLFCVGLVILGALSSTIWGPMTCGGVGP